jgi:hypothetical protein
LLSIHRNIALAKHHHGGIAMATCPICRSEAQEIELGFLDGKTFRCPKHDDFDVSDTALTTRLSASSNEWEAALKKATSRASAGKRPKILDLDF